MDVGANKPLKSSYRTCGLLMFFACGWLLFTASFFDIRLPMQTIAIVFLFSMGCFCLFLSKNAWLDIYENGLVYNSTFVPWDSIHSIQWVEEKDLYLVANNRNSIPYFRRIFKWPVPPSSKEAIDRVLQKKFKEINGNT
jgi:hypothetical protein